MFNQGILKKSAFRTTRTKKFFIFCKKYLADEMGEGVNLKNINSSIDYILFGNQN